MNNQAAPRRIRDEPIAAPLPAKAAHGLFFLINFSGGVLVFTSSVICFVLPFYGGGSPGSFMGAISFLTPSVLYLCAEWAGYYRRKMSVVHILGFVMFGFAAMCLFGIVTNVAEALWESGRIPDGFEWFIGIGLCLCTYALACGLFRLWYTRQYSNLPPADATLDTLAESASAGPNPQPNHHDSPNQRTK